MPAISIYEGFDLVGKTTLAAKISGRVHIYRPDYKTYDPFYSRNLAYLLVSGFADTVSYLSTFLGVSLPDVHVDRGAFSSYVYGRLYPDDSPIVSTGMVVSYLEKLIESFNKITVVHVSHSSYESAKRIYEHTLNNSSHTIEKFDIFSTFDDYWRMYHIAEGHYKTLYREVLSSIVDSPLRYLLSVQRWISVADGTKLDFEYKGDFE